MSTSEKDRNTKNDSSILESNTNSLDNLFQNFLDEIYLKLIELVGRTATDALFLSAFTRSRERHPFLARCLFKEAGVRFICDESRDVSQPELLSGYMDCITELMALLVDLTGDVLAKRIAPHIDEFTQNAQNLSENERGEP